MREHHGVDQTDAPGKPGSNRKRKRAQQARAEEIQAGRFKRQIESLEQPQRQQRLHDEGAGEGVQTEQGRKLVDDAAGWSECGLWNVGRMAVVAWQTPVEKCCQQSER